MIATNKFQPFRRRIKTLLAVEGAFIGLGVGSVVGIIWAILDWRGIAYLEWKQLGILLTASSVLFALIWTFRRIDDLSVARSIDRRAKLKDRLGTSAEIGKEDTSFADELISDANTHLANLKPRSVYPLRFKRIHLLAVVAALLGAGVLFLSNTTLFLPKETLAAKDSMQKEAKRLEELRKAIFDDKTEKESTNPELAALQKDLQRLQKDYEKAKMDPKEAMLRSEELAKKADELAKKMGEQDLDQVKQAESMMDKMEREALQKAGLEKADMDSVHMSENDFNQKMNAAQQNAKDAQSKVDELQKKLDSLKAQLNKPGLDAKAKQDLQKQIEKTEKELAEAQKNAQQAQKDIESMQLSKEAREVLQKIYNDPLWKEIQEAAAKIKQEAKEGAQSGRPKLSKEEREKLQKEMEELLKQLADDDFRKEYLKKLLEALKNAKSMGQCSGLGIGLSLGIGGPGPGPDNDTMITDTGKVRTDKPTQGKGSATPVFAPTERDNTRPGLEMTYEIKAPTFKGTKSSVPYQNVLPSYSKKAESALGQNQIPKEHQQRVKRYFESLKK